MLQINLWPKLFICSKEHLEVLELIFKELKEIDLLVQVFNDK